MAVRKIIRMGHPTLRKTALPLDPAEIGSDDFERLIDDMIDTLHDYGGIGLAAPQIDVGLRIAIVELPGGPSRYGELESMPLSVFVNPVIEPLDGPDAGYWEGCLSIPGMRGFVERPQAIRVTALDRAGNPVALEPRGFLATVFQHEFDHLDGTLYIDRLKHPSMLTFDDEFERYILPAAASQSTDTGDAPTSADDDDRCSVDA